MRKLTFLAFLTMACAPAAPVADDPGWPAGAELRVTPAQVAPGDRITLTLANRSDADIGYNLCPAALDRRVDGDWEPAPERPAEVCTMELRILRPGQTGDFDHTIPAALPVGDYRFRVAIEFPLGEGQVGIASTPFRVDR